MGIAMGSFAVLAPMAIFAATSACGRSAESGTVAQAGGQNVTTATAQAAQPEQSPAGQAGQSEADRVARRYYDSNMSRCGDSFVARRIFVDRSGSNLVEITKVVVRTRSLVVTEADRLNGLEGAADAWIETPAMRFASDGGSWRPWAKPETIAFPFRLLKKKGEDWQIEPFYVRGVESGYLQQFPCDDVPGHPTRLAREQAAREEVDRAAQVEAAEQEASDRTERARVEKLIAGQWAEKMNWGGEDRLTITRDGSMFSAVHLPLCCNVRLLMRGELLPNGVLRLITVKVEVVDPKRNSQERFHTFLLTLSIGGDSLTGQWNETGSGSGGTLLPFTRR